MSAAADIFYNPADVDGEDGSPVECTMQLIAAPETETTIIVYFDDQKYESRLPGVAIENNSPNIKALTADLAGEKLATYTVGGVTYNEISREKLNVNETLVNVTEASI